ncbi:hypothetical protein B566_EDAN012860 [Ephemera danica]|nr:hypothetical protein B566_EDAN012860 [Ephemera danica]
MALLEEHQNVHTGHRPYECNLCGKTFASKYCLKVHLKIHEVRPRPYSCEICSKTFMKQEHLNQHTRTHKKHKSTLASNHLCVALVAKHSLDVLRSLTMNASTPESGPSSVKLVGQHSASAPTFRVTSEPLIWMIGDLLVISVRRRLLDYHTRSVHTGERPYSCSECNATFVYPEHFKKHQRIHTGEKPFRCEVCGKAFNSRDNRNAHRFIHSNKKPYECLVCGLGFMRKPLLYSHMQSQGHVHDTIVVNQPQVPAGASNVVSEAAAAAGISSDKVYVSTSDDPEPQHVEEVEHILIEGPVHFSEGEEQNHPRAILVPVSSGEAGDKDGQVQLVEIRLQGGPGEQPQWINLSTS